MEFSEVIRAVVVDVVTGTHRSQLVPKDCTFCSCSMIGTHSCSYYFLTRLDLELGNKPQRCSVVALL